MQLKKQLRFGLQRLRDMTHLLLCEQKKAAFFFHQAGNVAVSMANITIFNAYHKFRLQQREIMISSSLFWRFEHHSSALKTIFQFRSNPFQANSLNRKTCDCVIYGITVKMQSDGGVTVTI